MTSQFEIKDHVVDCQYIREYPRATGSSQEDVMKLVVRQYTPKSNPNPQPGDITIIAAHANGFPKELYEALWDDLLRESGSHGFKIRSIFIADVAWQGVSGVLNEDKLGNDPAWYDHSRDLLYMINQLHHLMPRPLIGIGHSFGGTMITQLALLHPRLFTTVVLLDPTMNSGQGDQAFGFSPLTLSVYRRDLWPSRAEARAAMSKSAFYKSWDPRAFDAWIRHGLRDLPTPAYPENIRQGEKRVTLATTKHQEVFTYLRPLLQGTGSDGQRVHDRSKVLDIDDEAIAMSRRTNLYRPEPLLTWEQLPHLRPSALYILGGTSMLSMPIIRQERLARTGAGVGGSGGVEKGRVAEKVLEEVGHLVAMDEPGTCARHAAEWIEEEMRRWREEERELEGWWKKTRREKTLLDDEWLGIVETAKKTASKL